MEIKFKWLLGFLGLIGFLGYILNEPYLYVFFSFFSFFIYLFRYKRINLYKISIWLGSAVLILSGLILWANKIINDVLAVAIFFGLLIFMVNFFSYIGIKEPKDERLRKIGTVATTHSWYLTLILISVLIINNILYGRMINLQDLGFILFVMVASMLIINIYLNWKGDVE